MSEADKKDDENKTDEAGAEGIVEEGGKKKFDAKKIVLFVLLPLLMLGASGTGAYFLGYLDAFLPHAEVDCTQVTEEDEHYAECQEKLAKEAVAETPGVFIEIPDMIVNLNATTKQPRFLKISLKIELADPTQQKAFEDMMPRVVDQFQTYLRELRIEDLRGSSGIYRMKIELLSRVKAAVPDIDVRDVLFQEMLVQ